LCLAWVASQGLSGAEAGVATNEFLLVQMCDPQFGLMDYGADKARFLEAIGQINELQPALVIICGDLVQTAGRGTFADFAASKAHFKVPCYCAPGNHDLGDKPTAEALALYRECIGEDYHAVERGDCVFLLVNTQLWKSPVPGESEKHDAWFLAALESASAKGRRIFVAGHIPVFSVTPDEPDGHDNLPLAKRRQVLDWCHHYGVVAYLAGHSHRARAAEYLGMQIVQSETTSFNVDFHPHGFRVWHVGPTRPFAQEFVRLKRPEPAPQPSGIVPPKMK